MKKILFIKANPIDTADLRLENEENSIREVLERCEHRNNFVFETRGAVTTKALLNYLLSLSPNIDVWGMNVYRSVRPETIFEEWKEVSDKPMYLSETGADSYMQIATDKYEQGVNELAQADATEIILKATFNGQDICSGVTLFQFTDGWWKAGNNNVQDTGGTAPNSTGVPFDGSPNEEFWGIVDIDRNKKKVYDVVKDIYTNVNSTNN